MVVESINCTPIIGGNIDGPVIFSRNSISFIGGIDPVTGIILDPLNDQQSKSISDKIFVFPFGKGSSGAGLVLLELARVGRAPKALITLRTDMVLLTGPLISSEFYKTAIPMFNVNESGMEKLSSANYLVIDSKKARIEICDNEFSSKS